MGFCKVVLYLDTVLVKPVSRPFLDSVLVSKDNIYGCRSVSRVEKIHFADSNNTFSLSSGLETVSESVSKDILMDLMDFNGRILEKLRCYWLM